MKKRVSLILRCEYTDAELAEKRDELSEVVVECAAVEFAKGNAAKAYKEQLDGLYSRSGELAHQIKNRGENRSVDCLVEFHKPNIGEKTTIRLDTGELVKTENMTESERQEEIEFDQSTPETPPGDAA